MLTAMVGDLKRRFVEFTRSQQSFVTKTPEGADVVHYVPTGISKEDWLDLLKSKMQSAEAMPEDIALFHTGCAKRAEEITNRYGERGNDLLSVLHADNFDVMDYVPAEASIRQAAHDVIHFPYDGLKLTA